MENGISGVAICTMYTKDKIERLHLKFAKSQEHDFDENIQRTDSHEFMVY